MIRMINLRTVQNKKNSISLGYKVNPKVKVCSQNETHSPAMLGKIQGWLAKTSWYSMPYEALCEADNETYEKRQIFPCVTLRTLLSPWLTPWANTGNATGHPMMQESMEHMEVSSNNLYVAVVKVQPSMTTVESQVRDVLEDIIVVQWTQSQEVEPQTISCKLESCSEPCTKN